MSKIYISFLFTIIINLTFAQENLFNLDFENVVKKDSFPHKWQKKGTKEYTVSATSTTSHLGKYSLKISSNKPTNKYSYCRIEYKIPSLYDGKKILFEGYMKLKNVESDYASLYIRLNGANSMLAFDDMKDNRQHGTSDWKKFSIKIDLPKETTKINVGAILVGAGTLWIDDFKVYIDGKDIVQLKKNRTLGYNTTSVLLNDVNYFDTKLKRFKKASILISKGKIKKIAKKIAVADSVQIINVSNKFLIPGLIDSHIHLFQSGGLYTRPDVINLKKIRSYDEERKWLKENTEDLLKRYLRLGITTIIDVGGPLSNFEIRDRYKNSTNHPSIYLTGPLISTYQPEAFKIKDAPIIKANTIKEAIELVQEQLPYKPDFIKIWYIKSSDTSAESNFDIVKATINEAHKNHLKVAVHATELHTTKLAIKAGADILVHSVKEAIDDTFIKKMKEKRIVYIPTLLVSENYVNVYGRNIHPSSYDFEFSNPHTLGTLYDVKNKNLVKKFDIMKSFATRKKKEVLQQNITELKNLKKLSLENIIIATGTDAGNIGTLHASSYYDELKKMKKSGLSNTKILMASTINGAKLIGKENEIGSIEVEKFADLVLLDANPLDDIQNLQQINTIIKRGNILNPENIIINSPKDLVQQQVNGYNARNIDAFLAPYAEDVEIYRFPNTLISKGKTKMIDTYKKLFEKTPDLHCEIVNRIINGNTIIDHERITGFSNKSIIKTVAVYKIEHHKITKVYFLN